MSRASRLVLAVLAVAVLAPLALASTATAFGPLASFGSYGEGAGQFRAAQKMAIASDGTIFLSEFNASRIDAFSPAGQFLFAFGKEVNPAGGDICTSASGCREGVADGSAGAIHGPEGIAFGPGGEIFVADEDNHRVDVFSPAGEFRRAFGKEVNADQSGANPDVCTPASGCRQGGASGAAGAIEFPAGLDFDDAGRLFIASSGNNRIDVFTAEGEFLRAFGQEVDPDQNSATPNLCTPASGCRAGRGFGTGGALSSPIDVEVAPTGQVVVDDLSNHRIDVFTPGGEFLRAFGKLVNQNAMAADRDICNAGEFCTGGSESDDAGALKKPAAIAIDGNGTIYVSDSLLNRIDRFGPGGRFVDAFGAGVIDGSDTFQICTSACQKGSFTRPPGALPHAEAVALDCHGALYATSEGANADDTDPFGRIQRFGEPGTPLCGPAPPPPPRAAPSNKFRFAKLVLNKRRGTAMLLVEVPGAGALSLSGKGLKTVKRIAKSAGKVKLPIQPVGKAKRKLAKAGALKLKAKITFTPTGGAAATQLKTVSLKRSIQVGGRPATGSRPAFTTP